jgi:regulator of RNase E activity RraA
MGGPVEVGGLKVQPGDLLHGDCHGVLSIPKEIAPEIPSVAARIQSKERKLIALCQSAGFSLEKLTRAVKEVI